MAVKKADKLFLEKRKDFTILKQKFGGKGLIYADNAATTQKPQKVIRAICEYYEKYNANIHRGMYSLSEIATKKYEEAREKVARFVNCDVEEVVFTRGTTQSINMVAFGLLDEICDGDEIVLSEAEHHANLVPWQEVAKRKGAVLKFIPVTSDFRIDMKKAREIITKKTKIVSLIHASNVLGSVFDVLEIGKIAHRVGALFVLDAAQSIAHQEIDVKKLGCDYMVFSAHKMYGPTGVGVLFGKRKFLEKLKPFEYGGYMIDEVGKFSSTYASVPQRFEAGTPNIAGVIGLGAAIDYLLEIGMERIEKYERVLSEYFLEKVKEVGDIILYGSKTSENRAPVFSVGIEGIHSHDISDILNRDGIATRSGHHCAMPLMKVLGTSGTARISLGFYNTFEEIDLIIDSLKKVKDSYEKGEFLK